VKKKKPTKNRLRQLYAKVKKTAKRVAKDVKGTYGEFSANGEYVKNTVRNAKSLLAKKTIKKDYKGLGAKAVKNSRKRKAMLRAASKN